MTEDAFEDFKNDLSISSFNPFTRLRQGSMLELAVLIENYEQILVYGDHDADGKDISINIKEA